MDSKTFVLINGSCNRRGEEIAAVERFLSANGWQTADRTERADLALVFACGAFPINVDEMLARIAEIRGRLKSGAELIVGGCLPSTSGARLKQVFEGRTVTYADYSALDALPGLEASFASRPRVFGPDAVCPPVADAGFRKAIARRLTPPFLFLARRWDRLRPAALPRKIVARLERGQRLIISVAAGCSRTCPYCAKRFGFGPLRSKPVAAVVGRIAAGAKRGFRLFELYADSLGDYGRDLGGDFGALLDGLTGLEARFSVGLYDLHPQDFIKHFDRILALSRAGRLHYLYVIVESGNERVLRSMGREMDVADLVRKLQAIRAQGHIFMQSTILVGYPGETDREFEDTLAVLKKLDFDNVFVHSYGPMPGTASAGLPDRVAPEVLAARLQKIAAAGIRHDAGDARREFEHACA